MRPVFLIANQRSGTNAVRSALMQSHFFEDFGEVFNPDGSKYAGNFFHFLRLDANLQLLKPGLSTKRFLDYYSYLNILADKPFGIIDAKYDSLHLFNPEAHPLLAAPALLALIEKVGGSVVHLTRNPLQIYISHVFAVQTSVWHVRSDDSNRPRNVKMNIDIVDMIHNIDKLTKERAAIQNFLNLCSHVLTIDYSDLFSRDGAPDLGTIWRFFDLSPQEFTPLINKSIRQPLKSLLENYEDVEAALREYGMIEYMAE